MRVTLRMLEGPYRGREFTFDHHDTFLIGRSENAHLYLPDDRFFSRHHCLLEIAPPRCFLRDLGSTNGTFVNGQKVSALHVNTATAPFNITGLPAISVPVTLSSEKLPINIQLVARWFDEATLLELGEKIQTGSPAYGIRPIA